MWPRQLFIGLSIIFLLAAIPFGVYLVKQEEDLNANASTGQVTNIAIIPSGSDNFKITTPLARIQLNFVPGNDGQYPTDFRVATSLSSLNNATVLPFKRNGEQVDVQVDPNPGPKTIYVQFKVNNNWSTVYSASTILDTQSIATPVPVSVATTVPKVLGIKTSYDLNQDGVVNDLDAKFLQSQMSAKSPNLRADLNHDGVVNLQDYALLLKSLP